MDLVVILIYLCLAIIALTLVVMVVFGLKNASSRLGAAESRMGLFAFAVPIVLIVLFYFLNQGHPEGAWTMAFIWASIITSVLVLLALLASGVRGLISR